MEERLRRGGAGEEGKAERLRGERRGQRDGKDRLKATFQALKRKQPSV